MDTYKNLQLSERGAWLSIYAYIFISAIKLFFGYVGDSAALKADGLNNLTDVVSSTCVLVGLKFAQKPADGNHPHGHLRAETVASLFSSFVMLFIGLQVLASAITQLFSPALEAPSIITAYVSFFCSFLMLGVYRYNIRLARKTKSLAIKSAAFDNLSDALVSLGTTIGILGSIYGYPMLDMLTALLIGLIVMKTGFDIAFEAIHTLIDGFDAKQLKLLKRALEQMKDIQSVRSIKGRMHASIAIIDIVAVVRAELTVHQSAVIIQKINSTIQAELPGAIVSVQLEPDRPKR